jgi:3-phenylpropionate/cinnamic acid dioxygenase small subunit
MHRVPADVLQAVQALVYESCSALNDESWSEYLKLCDPHDFRYQVVNYSPEIRREQCWADRDYKGMKAAFDLFPRHNTDHSKLTRHAVVSNVQYDADKQLARVSSNLTVYRTQEDGTMSYLEAGQTGLFAIGTYIDRIRIVDGEPILMERTVRLQTRQIDVGSHKPL